jgi:hypothetical protein
MPYRNEQTAPEAVRDEIQTLPTHALTWMARHPFESRGLALAELASRGFDLSGNWVGFPEALAIQQRNAK